MHKAKDSRVPVTIITGFLGAGKTTLLNRIIKDNPQKRFAIIENEFGKIPLDHELVVGSKESIFEISQGCICCSLNHELGNLLEELIQKDQPFDHLLIETTGVADPAGVAAAFISQQRRQTYFRLDGTLCLVDLINLEKALDEQPDVAGPQIAFADKILLNKSDLIQTLDEGDYDRIIEMVRKLNAHAPIITGNKGKFGDWDLLNIQAHQTDKLLTQMETLPNSQELRHRNIVSQSFSLPQFLDEDKFKTWIYKVLNFQGEGLYRIKGILAFAGEKKKIIFQSVKNQFVFERAENWLSHEIPKSKIVFIGKNLNRRVLERQLRSCLVK